MVQMRDEQLKHETEARLDEADGPAELTARMGPPPPLAEVSNAPANV